MSQLQSQIDTDLKPAAQTLNKDHEALKARMLVAANDLAGAIQGGSGAALIQRHLGPVNDLMPEYARLVTRAKTLLAEIGKLKAAEGSKEHKALATLTAAVSELQGRMDRNYLKLKTLQDQATRAIAQGKNVGENFAERWAEMEAFMTSNLELANKRLEQIKLLHGLADDAVAERDAAELAKIQGRNEERTSWKPTKEDVNRRLIEFFADAVPQLSQELRDQATRDRVKFDKMATEISRLHGQIDVHYNAIKALKLKALDPKKVAAALEIPAGNDAKVKKALEASSLERGLEGLAKELQLKMSGAQMVAKLAKKGLL